MTKLNFIVITIILLSLLSVTLSYHVQPYRSIMKRTSVNSDNLSGQQESARSRRRKAKSKSSSQTASNSQTMIKDPPTFSESLPSTTVTQNFIPEIPKESKLNPLKGTTADIQQEYQKKNVIERYIEELSAPTPIGQEPKTVQLVKSITWFGVMALVLVEIFVSIKSGSTPLSTATTTPSTPMPSLSEMSYPSSE